MPSAAAAISTNRTNAGTCPHGLPPAACPICRGMTGGNSTTKRDIPRNPGEMTYNQCAAIGAMLRAQKHAKEQSKLARQNYLQALADFQKNIANTRQRLMELAAMSTHRLPAAISKPINFVLNNIAGKILDLIQNLPNKIAYVTHFVFQKFAEISDKLAAVYGELKAAIAEKISKFLSGTKKKFRRFFFVFGTFESDNEDKKIEEAKRTFELKTFLNKLTEKLKNKRGTPKDEH